MFDVLVSIGKGNVCQGVICDNTTSKALIGEIVFIRAKDFSGGGKVLCAIKNGEVPKKYKKHYEKAVEGLIVGKQLAI